MAMKLRRVMRVGCGRGSKIRADGERKCETTEERLRLLRLEGRRTFVPGKLFVFAGKTLYRRDMIARAHTVQRCEPAGVRGLIEVDRAGGTNEGVVSHIGLKRPNGREDANAHAGR